MLCDYAELEFPLDVNIDPYLSTIHGCNGIVCIISYDWASQQEIQDIYLWNPSIHKVISLPPVIDACMCNIGFGFDSETEDYKVVRIEYFNGPNFDQNPPEVEIFNLSTGTWQNISHLNLPYTICKDAAQAYVKGATHWLARDMRSTRSRSNLFVLIVSFHLVDEVFGEIMLPNSDDWLNNARGANFQESLSNLCRCWYRRMLVLEALGVAIHIRGS
ncbi:F-box protein At3g07870-like [Cornus florida]|uniref:F-box protein At3g07870-like n=1 Tax=Cornus florida TaxID=4283 RepID=UPI0028A021BC|nr:F-box protein At3g07870-like [Cornus florida]